MLKLIQQLASSVIAIAALVMVAAGATPPPSGSGLEPSGQKLPQAEIQIPRYFDSIPASPETSLSNDYHGICAEHAVEVRWTQSKRGRPGAVRAGTNDDYRLDFISVTVNHKALDEISARKLIRFLRNVADKLSKFPKYLNRSRFISGVSSLCFADEDDVYLLFYFHDVVSREAFGSATVNLRLLQAELTEGEGPDPLDGKPPLPPLDADGHRPKIRYPWGGWRDADLPK